MKNKNIYIVSLYTIICIAIIISSITFISSGFRPKKGAIPGSDATNFAVDSTFRDGRQMGLVNLDKFIILASRLGTTIFNPQSNLKYSQDSVTITLNTKKTNILFSDYTNIGQTERLEHSYHNFPITILNGGTGFTAELIKKDSVRYIRIPYLVLASLAEYVSGPSAYNNEKVSYNTLSTTSAIDALMHHESSSSKVQTEGIVMRNFSDIQSMKNLKHNSNPVEQLKIAWKYVNDNWIYINDPTTNNGTDTWRSATETITNYYSSGHVYTGDCDDYAILMASFARQCGLESRLVCSIDGGAGHMYAEFKEKRESGWHNMDWGMPFDSKERYGTPVRYIYDL